VIATMPWVAAAVAVVVAVGGTARHSWPTAAPVGVASVDDG